ncbi:MAG: DUF1987 domain-containing protein [Cyclobacteriaceae bacterium]
MTNLYIPRTAKTPDIFFDLELGNFEIKGRSIPENSVDFYSQVMQWLDEYEKAPSTQTELIVKLEYFNTSSSKCLIDVFRRLEKLHNHGSEVHVQWYYEEEDEDMKESGEDFRDLVKMPVALVPIITDITEEQDR